MSFEEKLLNLRKSKHLSQEEVAEKLNVTRQTISKWETGQSTPDFDKIIPLCELYEISADELLTDKVKEKNENKSIETIDKMIFEENKNAYLKKKAIGICLGILLYFVAVAWEVVSIPSLKIDPILSTGIFLVICGFATFIIVYTNIVYRNKKKKDNDSEQENKLQKQIIQIVALVTVIIYLLISFLTMAWYITWIIWVVFALVEEIVKLVFSLKGDKNEE